MSRFLALAFVLASLSPTMAAEKTLSMKLISFYVGEKDGAHHLVGATISSKGSAGTKEYFVRPREDGSFEGNSVYYFENGSSIQATFTGNNPEKDHGNGVYVITGGTGEYKDAKGNGTLDCLVGGKSPLHGATVCEIVLNVTAP